MSTDYTALLARHHYAIVDRVGLHDEPWHETLPMTPLVPRLFRNDTESMPALLPLDPKAPYLEDLAEDLSAAEANNFKPVVSILLTVPEGTDPEQLKWHLTACLTLQSPQGKAFLRYYDPLVFLHLDRVFKPLTFREYFYGAVVANWTVRFQKDWITLPAPEIENYEADPLGLMSMLTVSASQREGLDRIGTVNLALKLWQEKTGHPYDSLDQWRNLAAKADASIAADEKQLPDAPEDDLAKNALQLLLHPEN